MAGWRTTLTRPPTDGAEADDDGRFEAPELDPGDAVRTDDDRLHLPGSEFARTGVRTPSLDRQLHCTSTPDRSPAFVEDLTGTGRGRATAFLAGVRG